MDVRGISWAGSRTKHLEEMTRLFRDVMGLPAHIDGIDFAAFDTPNGDTFEVFSLRDEESAHLTTGPVVGFFVGDIASARRELEASDMVRFFGATIEDEAGWSWAHFRAPDGNIYEVTSGPHPTLGD